MADQIKKVEYFIMEVADKPGEAAGILKVLSKAGVNLLAFTGFPSGRKAQLDFIPKDAAAFAKAAKKAGLAVKAKKSGFLVQGKDRKGAVAAILDLLAAAKLNVTAIDAVAAGSGRFGAILWVNAKDVAKAAKALGVKK
jgi:hypothetical protein